MIKIKTALLSVFNKEGILELANELAKHNVEILSSGGTAKYLKSNNIDAAVQVGKKVAERALENGVKKVVFDRSGYRYHGRIKALADSAREAGLEF